ncbi:uncharacterized protein N7473_002116 [Penicillium subrubescens]|jgi:hypothetical protein|uniref:Uncharacterized protein n=1 Tax=Penicillium subrubescens TaxID=1316194 RepID=A0A1Q5UFN8_9EURO|nr:uncharacterized protein N7473_002116 [Penicillium subrubescens]KAJ5905200.1 hypothetical protein N7473_002116 [Penicillium subrubescens]OKP11284.1 hypothetical protein PENSUB_3306 [Penicillium subrubescens]
MLAFVPLSVPNWRWLCEDAHSAAQSAPQFGFDILNLFLDGIQPKTPRSRSVVKLINKISQLRERSINMEDEKLELPKYAIDDPICLI